MNRTYSRCGGYGNSQSVKHNPWIEYFKAVMRGEMTMPEARQRYEQQVARELAQAGYSEGQIQQYLADKEERMKISKQRAQHRKGIREEMRIERSRDISLREQARNETEYNRLPRGKFAPIQKYHKDYRHRLNYGAPSGIIGPVKLIREPNFRRRGMPKRGLTPYEAGRKLISTRSHGLFEEPQFLEEAKRDVEFEVPVEAFDLGGERVPVRRRGRPRNPKQGFLPANVINPKTGLPYKRVPTKARVLSPQELADIRLL